VDARLVVLPAHDLVNIELNGTDHGSFIYDRFTTTELAHVELYGASDDLGAQFDEVSFRVSPSP